MMFQAVSAFSRDEQHKSIAKEDSLSTSFSRPANETHERVSTITKVDLSDKFKDESGLYASFQKTMDETHNDVQVKQTLKESQSKLYNSGFLP